ncbi:MAG: sulfite exporter TauE/SafE [Haloarculaceae archaeon]|jgi:sulfite exporter TauE/SafE
MSNDRDRLFQYIAVFFILAGSGFTFARLSDGGGVSDVLLSILIVIIGVIVFVREEKRQRRG